VESESRVAPVAMTEPETESNVSIRGKGSRMTAEVEYEESLQLQSRALNVSVDDG
jgi:hypothetical protein